MRKILIAAAAAAALLTAFVMTPARADHSSEGTVTVGGIELCSTESGETVKDGKCTWVATDAGGWVGTGPFTISWTTLDGVTTTVSCGLGESCTSASPDPIPVGATVTTDGSGGGTFAAGDADEHDA